MHKGTTFCFHPVYCEYCLEDGNILYNVWSEFFVLLKIKHYWFLFPEDLSLLIKRLFCLNVIPGRRVAPNLCTATVSCAKCFSDQTIRILMRAWLHLYNIWITIENNCCYSLITLWRNNNSYIRKEMLSYIFSGSISEALNFPDNHTTTMKFESVHQIWNDSIA